MLRANTFTFSPAMRTAIGPTLASAAETIANATDIKFQGGSREALVESLSMAKSRADLFTALQTHHSALDVAIANGRVGPHSTSPDTDSAWACVRDALGLPNYNRPQVAAESQRRQPTTPVAKVTDPVSKRLEAKPESPEMTEDAETDHILTMVRDAGLPGFKSARPADGAAAPRDVDDAETDRILAMIRKTGLSGFKSSTPSG